MMNLDDDKFHHVREELFIYMMEYMNESDVPSYKAVDEFLQSLNMGIPKLPFQAYYFAVF